MKAIKPREHPPAAEPSSLAEQAYVRLEELIATLALQPGQIVSENGLAQLIGFGRTPVREALQQLAREGLVQVAPKLGILITQMDVRRQLKLIEVRREVERLIAGSAARYATDAQRKHFERLAMDMESTAEQNNGELFLVLDREFNRLMLESAHNEYASAAMKLTQGLSRRFWFAHYERSANLATAARLHAAIASAIADADVAGARVCLDRLMDNVEAFTRATINS